MKCNAFQGHLALETQEQARFEQLKTLKLAARRRFHEHRRYPEVDMSKNMAWCPAPGCGRVVAWPTQERSETVKTATVVCTCGTSFCFNCKHLTGHEPAPCHPFADFLTDLAAVRQQMQDAARSFLKILASLLHATLRRPTNGWRRTPSRAPVAL